MPIYDKTTKELLKDFAATLSAGQTFTTNSAVDWFKQRYPKIRPTTVRMHLEVMSTNSNSRAHHPSVRPGSGHDVFYKVEPGRFRLYDPSRDDTPNHPNVSGGAATALNGVEAEETEDSSDPGSKEFAYEMELRNNLAKNLHAIEDQLRLYKDEDGEFTGVEFPAGSSRRIDILAIDKNGDYVVIELKVSRGHERTVGQLARYMAWIKQNLAGDRRVRGLIVASNISPDLKLAASILPSVSLVEYEMRLSFRLLPQA